MQGMPLSRGLGQVEPPLSQFAPGLFNFLVRKPQSILGSAFEGRRLGGNVVKCGRIQKERFDRNVISVANDFCCGFILFRQFLPILLWNPQRLGNCRRTQFHTFRFQPPANGPAATLALSIAFKLGAKAARVVQKIPKRTSGGTNQLAIRVEKPEVIFHPIGTAVLVSGSNVMFLFTAGHVMSSTEDVFFRIPQKNGLPHHRPFKQMLQETHTGWIRSKNADVAMTVFVSHYDGDSIYCVPMDSLAANFDAVTEGDEVLVSGYPASVIELPRPALRGGLVSAKLDDEKLLIDVFTFPGNSGGPVFWKPSVGINVFGNQFGEGRYAKLIGLVLYSPLYTDQAVDTVSGRTRITFESNSGFTIIVSASR
jgi:hypothetical protein